ncbi:hypothetical protein V8E53_013652 [Lactarius tabidus]
MYIVRYGFPGFVFSAIGRCLYVWEPWALLRRPREHGASSVLRPGGVTVDSEALVGDPALGRVLVHRRDFVLNKHEEDAPTTGMNIEVPPLCTGRAHHDAAHVHVHRYSGQRVAANAFFREVDAGGAGRVGLMAHEDSPLLAHTLRVHGTDRWLTFSLGTRAEPAIAAQRLFEGLLSLEEQGAKCIYVEEVAEEREGLAFVNRVKKAAGTSLRIDICRTSL